MSGPAARRGSKAEFGQTIGNETLVVDLSKLAGHHPLRGR